MNQRSHHETDQATPHRVMPDAAFLQLGDGHVAYLRRVLSDDVLAAFPEVTDLEPGLRLWALHSADGRPIMLTDSREAALANATEAELTTVLVH